MRWPGIEPGSTAWKAGMLTTIPPSLAPSLMLASFKINKLERMQKRFTEMLPGLDILSEKERLNRQGLFSLEHRRLRGDLTEGYKILRGTDQLDSQYIFPKIGEPKTRGHRFR